MTIFQVTGNYNLCMIARDYLAKNKSKEAFIFSMKMDDIAEMLENCKVTNWSRRRRTAAEIVVGLVKENCGCV